MTNSVIEQLKELLENHQFAKMRPLLNEMNQINLAEFFNDLKKEQAIRCFRMLSKDLASDVFPELSPELQEYIISTVTDQELKTIINDLFVDDAVDMLEEMPANVVKRVLANANHETRSLINEFLKYPESSAGSVMTAEFVSFSKSLTVSQAIEYIRNTGIDKETVYLCYVTNQSRILEGVVSFKELLFAAPGTLIEEIMETDIVFATTTEDQEEVIRKIKKYSLLAIPVVDSENRIVGIITIDDAMDVMQEEATEDFEKMAAMTPSEKPYLKTSVFELAKNRIGWLLLLMFSAMFTGKILENYESALAAVPLLVTFIPMLMDTGGNSGSQSSTLIIRGMAVSEIKTSDWFKVLFKEMRVAMIAGIVLAAANFIRLIIQYPGQYNIACTVAITLFFTVMMSKSIGATLPLLAKRFKMDPAIMASPLITTIVDVLALIIYFNIAQVFIKF